MSELKRSGVWLSSPCKAPYKHCPTSQPFSGSFLLIGRPPGDSQIMPFRLWACFAFCLEKSSSSIGDLLFFQSRSNITSSIKPPLPRAHPHAPHVVVWLIYRHWSYIVHCQPDTSLCYDQWFTHLSPTVLSSLARVGFLYVQPTA